MTSARIQLWICLAIGALALPRVAAAQTRPQIDLDGQWQFRLDPQNVGISDRWYTASDAFPDTITVPGAWQAQGFGEPSGNLRHNYTGAAWYRKSVTIPASWARRIVWLRVGGAHRSATLFVNGTEIGAHEGFSAPFSFDITNAVHFGGTNDIAFRIENPPVKLDDSPDKQEPLLPTGMLNYIGNWGGFYGGVYLESTERTWIESTRISSDVAKRALTVAVQLRSAATKGNPVTVRVSANGVSQSSKPVELTASQPLETTLQLNLANAPLWSPEHPDLITASIEILQDGKTVDRKEERFGFRTIETRGNRLLLNGQPIYLRAYGDDNVEVLTGFPPASRAVYVQRLSLAKSYGFNAVRYHSMVPPRELFDAADEVGMLIMAELPAVYTQYFFAHQDYLHNELQSVLLAYRNHPSLLSLAFGNEFNLHWLKSDEDRRIFTDAIARFYTFAKQLAPSTLILSNDGFDLRPTDMVSIQGSAPPDRPTVRHEFGQYYCSLPDIGLIDKFTGVMVPDWLKAKQSWVMKNSLQDVYSEYLHNSQRLQQLGRKYQIERVRKNKDVSGYDYWLILDYPGGTGEGDSWEEGWFDYFWKPKGITPEQGREINAPVLLLIGNGVDDRTMWTDAPKHVAVSVSNFGPGAIENGTLSWSLRNGGNEIGSGSLNGISVTAADVAGIGEIVLDASSLQAAAKLELVLTLHAGQARYQNRWNFWAYPPIHGDPAAAGVVSNIKWDGLRRVYPWIGTETSGLKPSELLITDRLDATATEHLHRGGRVWLLLRENPSQRGASFFPASGGALGTVVRDHPALSGSPHDDFCDLQFYNLLQGAHPLPIDNWPASLTPIVGGIRTTSEFLSKAKELSRVSYAVEANAGGGKLLVTTLRLRENFDAAFPAALTLFDGFLHYAAGPDFQPSLDLPEKNLRRLVTD
jgi:hypothetical protein